MKRALLILLAVAGAAAAVFAPAAGAAPLSSLVAPPSACSGQADAAAPNASQMRAMRCMTNFARRQWGVPPLRRVHALERAGLEKSADMIRCDEFSHEACGHEFTYWMQRFGYLQGPCVGAGENIAWGSGRLGTVRGIFTAWIHSDGHRTNILSGSFHDFGIGLRIGRLEGNSGAHVWTQEFGSRAC
jgi:uncharacterized protein YkwD